MALKRKIRKGGESITFFSERFSSERVDCSHGFSLHVFFFNIPEVSKIVLPKGLAILTVYILYLTS